LEQSEGREIFLEQSLPSLGDELKRMMELDAIHLEPLLDDDDDNVLGLDMEELQHNGLYDDQTSSLVTGDGDIRKNGESTGNAANRTSKGSSLSPMQPMRLEVLRGK
jgi:hypothetical protein